MNDLRARWRAVEESARWSLPARCVASLALTALGIGIVGLLNSDRWAFRHINIANPGVPFVAVIALVALSLGVGPGIFATALSIAALRLFFWTGDWIGRAVVFVVTALIVVAIAEGQRRAQARATRAQTTYRAIIESMTDAVMVVDAAGRPLDANGAATAMLGARDRDDALGHIARRRPDGTPATDEYALLERVLAGEPTAQGDVAIPDDASGPRIVSAVASPLRDAGGRVIGAVSVSRDITERDALLAQIERERQLTRQIIEHAPVGMMLIRADDSTVLAYNEAYGDNVHQVSGAPPAIGDSLLDTIAPDMRPGVAVMYDEVRRTRETKYLYSLQSVVLPGRSFDGAIRPLTLADGMEALLLTAVDVTERVRNERERESLLAQVEGQAAQLEATFEAMVDGITVYDAKGNVARRNPAFFRILHFDPDAAPQELTAVQHDLAPHTPEGVPLERAQMHAQRALRGETVRGEVIRIRDGRGEERYLRQNAAPIRAADGTVTGAAIVFSDVTGEREREREREELLRLVEERRRFAQAIFDTVPVGLAVMDAGTLTFNAANPAYLADLPEPYRTRGVSGVPIARLFPDLVTNGAVERLRAICAGGPPLTRAASPYTHPTYGETYHDEMVVALPSATGVSTHALYQVVDVTEQVQGQRRIAALAQETGERAAQLEAVFASLTEGMMLIDAAGTITRANGAAERLLALDGEPLTTMAAFVTRFSVRQADGTPIAPDETIAARALAGAAAPYDLQRYTNGRGEERWMSVGAYPVRRESGGIVGVARTFRDVTEERAATEERERLLMALEQRERFTQAILDSVPVGLMVVGVEDGRVRTANNAYARFIDATLVGDDLTGQRAALLQPTGATTPLPEDAEKQYLAGLQTLATQRESATVREFSYPDYPGRGQTYWDLTGVPLIEADGAVRDVLVVTVDATEQTINRRRVEDLAHAAAQRAAELETIIANMPDGVIIASPRGEAQLMNNTAQAMLGLALAPDAPPEEQAATYAIRHPDGTPIPPEEIPVARASRGETFADVELLVRAARGDIFLSCRGAPIRDAGGAVTGAIVVFSDITGRKRAEQERERLLREVSEQRNLAEAVIDNAPAGIVVFGMDDAFTVRAANARYGALLDAHWRERSIVGVGARDILPNPGVADIMGIFRRVATSGEMFAVREYQFEGFARGEAYFDWSLVPLRVGGDETITGLLALATEVTDRVLSQQRIEELADAAAQRAAELETVIASVPVGIAIHAKDGSVVHTNAAGRAITGANLPPDEALGEIADDYEVRYPNGQPIPFDDLPVVRALRGETVVGYEFLSNARGGIHLLSGAAPILGAAGEITGAVFSYSDITPIKQLEQMKDEFVSIAAHELRTPLTAIKGYTELLERRLRDQPDRERERQSLRVIRKQADRLARLVNEMLDVSRIEAGQLQLYREPFDLHALAREVLTSLRVSTEAHTLTLDAEGEMIVDADAARIEQVLINLITNAITYSPDGGEVAVRIWRDEKTARLSVRDDGVGIASAEIAHLFERFYRTPQAGIMRSGGMGLGLYISNEIVARHGGTIRVESALGAGSAFTVSLPLEQD